MDVAYYLSELLGQAGEVNVPGLGHFVQIRLDGYYDKENAAFHPPGHKVAFEPQYSSGSALAEYIAERKNISLASAQYFTEKYINNLREESHLKDVAIADLGWLHFEGSDLIFKPVEAIENDPAFYGFSPIHLNRLEIQENCGQPEQSAEPQAEYMPETADGPAIFHESVIEPDHDAEAVHESEIFHEPVIEAEPIVEHELESFTGRIEDPVGEEKVLEQPVSEAPPLQPTIIMHEEQENEPVFEDTDEYNPPGGGRIWLIIILVVLAVAAGGVLALYQYNPAAFNKLMGIKATTTAVKKIQTVPADSDSANAANNTSTAVTDTTAKKTTAAAPASAQNQTPGVIDSTKARYEIIAGTFSTLKEANTAINNYKSIGFDAHIVNGAPGRKLKLSLGTFSTKSEATTKQIELIQSKKIQKDIWILKINPKK